MQLAIDIGNTRTKVAVYAHHNKCMEMQRFVGDYRQPLELLFNQYKIKSVILSSVGEPDASIVKYLKDKAEVVLELDSATPLPFNNCYSTPHTLGKDRLASVAGPRKMHPKKSCIVIDCGTCIKMEVLTAQGDYKGGNISPGIYMRLQAMNHFTARLPLPTMELPAQPIGYSTDSALQNGAIRGSAYEIDTFIRLMSNEMKGLHVILTGGDAELLSPLLQHKRCEVVPTLVLDGLNYILNNYLALDITK